MHGWRQTCRQSKQTDKQTEEQANVFSSHAHTPLTYFTSDGTIVSRSGLGGQSSCRYSLQNQTNWIRHSLTKFLYFRSRHLTLEAIQPHRRAHTLQLAEASKEQTIDLIVRRPSTQLESHLLDLDFIALNECMRQRRCSLSYDSHGREDSIHSLQLRIQRKKYMIQVINSLFACLFVCKSHFVSQCAVRCALRVGL